MLFENLRNTMDDTYKTMIGGAIADPYRIARAYDLDPVIAQAVKKLLRCGRKHKSRATDVREAITTLERWEEMESEDSQHNARAVAEGGAPDAADTTA